MTINVVNKKSHKPTSSDWYIGRPSPLGNPFTHLTGRTLAQYVCATRDEAIRRYEDWLDEQLASNALVREEFKALVEYAREGDVTNLVCWCAPLACHGHVLKRRIEERL